MSGLTRARALAIKSSPSKLQKQKAPPPAEGRWIGGGGVPCCAREGILSRRTDITTVTGGTGRRGRLARRVRGTAVQRDAEVFRFYDVAFLIIYALNDFS